MRILLFTGKGGVGKTTVAAATAVSTAAAGLRTLILSTDPAHSLGDAFDVALGDQPTEISDRLWGGELDTRARFDEAWTDVRDYVVDVLDWAGAGALEAEELSVVPGLDEVFALAELRERATSGNYDVIVVDCAPTAETLRLLSLPDVLAWYMERVFDSQRRITKLARPVMSRMTNMPVARDSVFSAVRRFYDRLDGVRDLLTDGSVTTARLVVNPERLVVAEARRTYTYLSLFGYHVDAVIANRMLPAALSDPWFDGWKGIQAAHLETIEEAFAPVPILSAELAAEELVGADRLGHLAEQLYGALDPAAFFCDLEPMGVSEVDGALVLSLHLPFTAKSEIELGRHRDELFLAVGPHRRAVVLPDALARREVVGARLDGDRLEVEFGERMIDPDSEAQAGGGGMPRPEPHEHRYHDECYACPVGSLFMSMDTASPDMMEHLLAAAHELLQVARSAIDAAEAVVDRQRESRSQSSRTEPRVHRIDLD